MISTFITPGTRLNCGTKQSLPGGPLSHLHFNNKGEIEAQETLCPIMHTVEPTGEFLTKTGAPEMRVWSTDRLSGERRMWREAKITA